MTDVQPSPTYGGQALIEGVMIRGATRAALAVRLPDNSIHSEECFLPSFSTGKRRRVPFVRGVLVLGETLVVGVKALTRSANLAVEEEEGSAPLSNWAITLTLMSSALIGIGVFFLSPLFIARLLGHLVEMSPVVVNAIEGLTRLLLLVLYVWAIGKMADVKRVYAYHGAEHMTVHAVENGDALSIENIRKYPKEHPRCGTAFLLTVMLVALVVFSVMHTESILVSAALRVVLIPVIASFSYEVIKWSALHGNSWAGKLTSTPGLWLQKITTHVPEADQIQVAIAAMEAAMALEESSQQ
jgi:uncharacterized protein YqhQ